MLAEPRELLGAGNQAEPWQGTAAARDRAIHAGASAANAFRQLAIDIRHVARVATLPFHHRDPFDRLLAAQALEEDCPIVSADGIFRASTASSASGEFVRPLQSGNDQTSSFADS